MTNVFKLFTVLLLAVFSSLLIACGGNGSTDSEEQTEPGTAYTITFDANSGTGGPTTVEATFGQPMPNLGTQTAPTRTELLYAFDGYFDSQTGGIKYYNSDLTSARTWDKDSNATLYARWRHMNETVWISSGSFQMGSPTNEPGHNSAPRENLHTVTLTAGFRMGKYLVTQELYTLVMGTNPSNFSSNPAAGEVQSLRPVESLSWYSAIVFCNRLSIIEELTPAYRINNSTNPNDWGTVPTSNNATWNAVQIVENSTGYRLPTEAQWEYACRAGTATAYNTGAAITDNTGWYTSNSNDRTHQAGLLPANARGLHDMHGNVWEWCWDWLAIDAYGPVGGTRTNPTGPGSSDYRVMRGGSYNMPASLLRSAQRNGLDPSNSLDYSTGLRVIRP